MGNFLEKIIRQEVSKIAQSGQTGSIPAWFNYKIKMFSSFGIKPEETQRKLHLWRNLDHGTKYIVFIYLSWHFG